MKSVESTELAKEEEKTEPEFKEISFFDCSENEESFIDCTGAEEHLSSSGSHHTESNSTHNTSTTTQEEDDDSIENPESQRNNFNGL